MFIFYTIFCLLGTASFLKIFHIAIQPGQILGWWGDHLMKLERDGHLFLSKAGGMCETCFSFWFSAFMLPLYLIIVDFPFPIWGAIIWCFFYHAISTTVTLWILKNI